MNYKKLNIHWLTKEHLGNLLVQLGRWNWFPQGRKDWLEFLYSGSAIFRQCTCNFVEKIPAHIIEKLRYCYNIGWKKWKTVTMCPS